MIDTEIHRRSFLRLASILGITVATSGIQSALMTASAEAAQNVPLKLRNPHTSESLDIQLFNGSKWHQPGLVACDWIMRDWRQKEVVHCDRRLYAALYVLQRHFNARGHININSGFRSQKTNSMLRGASIERAGGRSGWLTPAVNSLHLTARAVDFSIPGVDLKRIQQAVWELGIGGLGKYSTFVHMDTGSRRQWGR